MGFLKWKVITSKGEKDVIIPASWAGVTLKQYIQLATEWDGSDMVHLFSILSGLSVKALNESFDEELYENLSASTHFIYNEERTFQKAEKPKTITVGGKTLPVPANLQGLTIGQSIRVREALDKTKIIGEDGKAYANYEKVMAIALANYFQPIYDGKPYNDKRALELLPMFESMPVVEGYGIAVFLLRKLMNRGVPIGHRLRHLIRKCFKASTQREPR